MKEQEVIDGNKLIAEFMEQPLEYESSQFAGKRPIELQYDSSWDWQIPAWAKLVTLCQQLVTTKKNIDEFASARDSYYRFLDRYEQAVCTNNTLVGFKVFNETLKWYNINKATA